MSWGSIPLHAIQGRVRARRWRSGLTFGTISSLYGLNSHIIDRQYSFLITVVVLSAIVPAAAHWRALRRRAARGS